MTSQPLHTLIVDDEPIARARLKALCAGFAGQVAVAGEAASGAEALDFIKAEQPDLLLLDIAMADVDGLGVAVALGRMAAPPAVIFCTAYPTHALQAFEAAAVDYLLKPVARDRLARAIDRARALRAGTTPPSAKRWLDHLWVPHRDAMLRIDLRDVERIEAEGDYVRLVMPQASYLVHETMTGLGERLDPDVFVRVRRSMIVRTDLLAAVEHAGGGTWLVRLADGTTVRAGPTYWKALKNKVRGIGGGT